jgi:hypothetical protein
MTQVVTVRTDFADLNQMAQGLVGRVNETHVILPAGAPVDVGEWAQFAVTLHDGTPGFAGMGRCVTFVDNGDERQSHQRFDVVFDSLQFDPRGHQIYAHILALSGYGFEQANDGADATGQDGSATESAEASEESADADAYAYSDVPSEPAPEPLSEVAPAPAEGNDDERATLTDSIPVPDTADSIPVPAMAGTDDDDETSEATVIATRGDLQAAMASALSEPPPAAAPVATTPAYVAAPATAAVQIGATPVTVDVSVRYASEPVVNGVFDFASGLPFPAEPPRPPIAVTQRITPAPRPR